MEDAKFTTRVLYSSNNHTRMAAFLRKTSSMLKYVKTILTRVSFDAKLFEKELRKAIKLLVSEEVDALKAWCFKRFKAQYEPVLIRCFQVPEP